MTSTNDTSMLLSWVAFNNDFQTENRSLVNIHGPTYSFHKFHWKWQARPYAKHVILYSSKSEETRMDFLLAKLRGDFPEHNIEGRLIEIDDVINLQEIKSKIETLLLAHRKFEIDIFISAGTPTMQVAWYLCHFSLGIKTKLLQTRPPSKSKTKQSELIPVSMEKSSTPFSVTLINENLKSEAEHRVFDRNVNINRPIITDSLRMTFSLAEKVARTEVPVLILGSTGTGKEILARHIHENSNRKSKPLIAFNCSAFQDDILESRLFGHKKGSFTGATRDVQGIFKQADGGTLFLDEIGDISPVVQQSLLRVLQFGEIQPVGGEIEIVNVRIIAATQDLIQKCEVGKFRWDLYYRLAVAEFELPTLHERGEGEKGIMLDYFLEKTRSDFGHTSALKISKEARSTLINYNYPGNIREMENLVARLYAFFYDKGVIELKDLPKRILSHKDDLLPMENVERLEIIRLLKLYKGNQKKARTMMGIKHNATFTNKLRKYKIDPKTFLA